MARRTFIDDHIAANTSALGHFNAFAAHRARLTALASSAAPAGGGGSLCVLGAGNCFDLDLRVLSQRFANITLVDVDSAAINSVVERQPAKAASQFRALAPIDLSGMMHHLERWARFEVTPDELLAHSERTATAIRSRVGSTFDVVLSACMLSQMQLDVVRGLGDGHALLRAVSWTLTVTHFHTLAALTADSGTAVFATDLTADAILPLAEGYTRQDALALVTNATDAGKVFDFANPQLLRTMLTDDPTLKAAFGDWRVADAWIWHNGPDLKFLVYGALLPRSSAADPA